MNQEPLVTVNILSFNRKDELRNTLTKVFEQDYKNIEVIVVDNASSDGSSEMVNNEFPSVQLIQMEKNIGIAGWNEGFKAAKGEYVLVLDDDSYPDRLSIEKGIYVLNTNEMIAIVAFNILDQKRSVSQTAFYKKPYLDFVGCGAMIRRDKFLKVEGFDPSFFIYAHELDFSIRILNAGFEIEYCSDAIVFHRSLNTNNVHPINNSYRYYNHTVSFIRLLMKYLDKKRYLQIIVKLMINRLLVALYFGRIKEYFRIIKYLYLNKYISQNQVKIRKDVLTLYNLNIPIFDRTYFGGLVKNHPKIFFPLLYFSSIIFPIERKNLFIE